MVFQLNIGSNFDEIKYNNKTQTLKIRVQNKILNQEINIKYKILGPCQDTWVIKKGFQSEGAIKVAQPLTLLDCLSNCSSISYCIGAEFNVALSLPECWLHYDSSMFSKKLSNPNIVQYQIVQRCSNSWEKLTGRW